MIYAIAVATALAFGFLSGLFTFKVKQQWCPVCGNTLTCHAPHVRR